MFQIGCLGLWIVCDNQIVRAHAEGKELYKLVKGGGLVMLEVIAM